MHAFEPGIATCENCGRQVQFAINQSSKLCPSCGTYITIRPMQVKTGDKDPEPPKCFVCMDRGSIIFNRQSLDFVYEVIARCNCEAGVNRREKAWPLVTNVKNVPDLRFVAHRNQKAWERANKKRGA